MVAKLKLKNKQLLENEMEKVEMYAPLPESSTYGSMEIFVKTLTGKTITLDVDQ